MYRLLLLLSLIPIIAGLLLHWWFGTRILFSEGRRLCRCDLEHWQPDPQDTTHTQRADDHAVTFAIQLRNKALTAWKEHEPKAAKARESNRRFGMIAPPMSGVIAIFAVIVAKIPPIGAFAIFVAATAIALVTSLMSLPGELAAISRHATKVRQQGSFPNSIDEEAIVRCAYALSWKASLPAILQWLNKKK